MVYQTPNEATDLKQMIADETKHLLERIEKLETELAAQREAEPISRPLRQMNSKTGE